MPLVIHAVGTDYRKCAGNEEKGDKYLARAYVAALDRAKEKGLEAVGFSLLSMLSCQGVRTSHQIVQIAIKTVVENSFYGLKEVHFYGLTEDEFYCLIEVARGFEMSRLQNIG